MGKSPSGFSISLHSLKEADLPLTVLTILILTRSLCGLPSKTQLPMSLRDCSGISPQSPLRPQLCQRITYTSGLDSAPRSVRLAGSPGGTHQHERGFALDENLRLKGEAFPAEPPLCRSARIATEHSWGKKQATSALSTPEPG